MKISADRISALIHVCGDTDKAREILDTLGIQSGARYLQECDEINYAHTLLKQRTPRPDVVTRLCQRYQFNARTAYRRIDSALDTPLTVT